MSYFIEQRKIVNPDGEVIADGFKRVKQRKFINDKWSLVFFKSVGAMADADCSKIAYRVFLYMLSTGLSSVPIVIDKSSLAKDLALSPSFLRRAVRELVELNALLEGPKSRGQPTYCFNPRLVWYGSTDQRPQDLSMYPEIGAKQKHETSPSRSKATGATRIPDTGRNESNGDAPGSESSDNA